jgi:hypothetical protein
MLVCGSNIYGDWDSVADRWEAGREYCSERCAIIGNIRHIEARIEENEKRTEALEKEVEGVLEELYEIRLAVKIQGRRG